MLLLRHTIRTNHAIQRTRINPLHRISAKNAVRNQSVDGVRAFFFEEFSGPRDGVGRVCEVVDEDCGAVLDAADEEHGCVLAVGNLGWAAFLGGEG